MLVTSTECFPMFSVHAESDLSDYDVEEALLKNQATSGHENNGIANGGGKHRPNKRSRKPKNRNGHWYPWCWQLSQVPIWHVLIWIWQHSWIIYWNTWSCIRSKMFIISCDRCVRWHEEILRWTSHRFGHGSTDWRWLLERSGRQRQIFSELWWVTFLAFIKQSVENYK